MTASQATSPTKLPIHLPIFEHLLRWRFGPPLPLGEKDPPVSILIPAEICFASLPPAADRPSSVLALLVMERSGPPELTTTTYDGIGPPSQPAPETVLERVFGYHGFRPGQREIVEHVVRGGSAFVLMPTGGGKSLCYQLPALLRPGLAVVVSPLISLMKDQVDALHELGVAAARLDSSLNAGDAREVLATIRGGRLDLLYVSPERLMTEALLGLLDSVPLALVAIDEAHCVSQWGHDFRPEYVQLAEVPRRFPGVPLIALTATADDQTREDVRRVLGLTSAPVFSAGFDRPNIRYLVAEKRDPVAQLRRFLDHRSDEPGIVYCSSRKRVEQVAHALSARGVSAAPYHAGLPAERRSAVQEAFTRDDLRVVVATVAFGLGIDKPNVRFVVHYDLPRSIELYYQETGRAGRDGLPADALLLFSLADVMVARALIEGGSRDSDQPRDPEQVRVELHKLNAMVGLAQGVSCRREALLGYFGEPLPPEYGDVASIPAPAAASAGDVGGCGNCDVCLDPPEVYDATEHARMALSCVYRVGQRFGMGHVIDVLRGADTVRMRELSHDGLSTYGIGAAVSRDAWTALLRQLIHRGYLYQDIAQYSVLKLTSAAGPILRGEQSLVLARPRFETLGLGGRESASGGRSSAKKRRGDAGGATSPEGPRFDAQLFERLRALRKRLADERKVPPYVVFSDATLRDMVALRPRDAAGLLEVNGVGEVKLERYGKEFLEVLAAASPGKHSGEGG